MYCERNQRGKRNESDFFETVINSIRVLLFQSCQSDTGEFNMFDHFTAAFQLELFQHFHFYPYFLRYRQLDIDK